MTDREIIAILASNIIELTPSKGSIGMGDAKASARAVSVARMILKEVDKGV